MGALRIAVLWRPRRNVELQERFSEKKLEDDSLDEARHHCIALKEAGYSAELVQWIKGRPDLVYESIKKLAAGLIFNASSEEEVAFCEACEIPYVGSGMNLVPLDKAVRKKIWVFEGIPTPRFITLGYSSLENIESELAKARLTYPVFVKPVRGRGSSGITDDSIVYNERDLRKQAIKILKNMNQFALVEKYIKGREISVGIIGNGEELLVLPLLEVIYHKSCTNTFEHKMNDMEILKCPADIDFETSKVIRKIAAKAFQVLGARDYGRIDLILTAEKPYLLELNTFPGLSMPDPCSPGRLTDLHVSYMGKMAQACGRSREWLLSSIVEAALKRYRANKNLWDVA